MRYTIKATNKKGNSLKTIVKAENEDMARLEFLKEYSDSHWKFNTNSIDWIKLSKRYTYSIVGMGIFSLLGEIYEGGRVEIYDRESNSPYSDSEGGYFMPKSSMNDFYKFFDDLETDFPIKLDFGSMEMLQQAVSEELDIPVDKLNDKKTMKKYREKKYQEYLKSLDPKERARLKELYGE